MRGHEQGSCRVFVRRAPLHEALVFGLPYRILVCLLGFAITLLSVTGVYIWWKNWRVQKSKAHRSAAAAAEILSE